MHILYTIMLKPQPQKPITPFAVTTKTTLINENYQLILYC